MTTWLITGGAGYIGAHVARAFRARGIGAVTYDDLSTGRREFLPEDVPLVVGTVLDADLLRRTVREHRIDGVVHLAGFKYAGVSVERPLHTYEQNVVGMMTLLRCLTDAGVERCVFSSSAAVYGTPDVDLVTEDTPQRPESPYGESKLIGEWLLRDQARTVPLRYTCLRYFNVVGSGTRAVYDVSPHNLFPLVFDAVLAGRTPRVNGDDYPTPDGTCVRDYVHVADLALAHVVAAERLDAGVALAPAYNLGSGDGTSVGEIMRAIAAVTGYDFTPEVGPRRAGDPARIVASGTLAARDLDWQMRHSLTETVQSAWEARRAASV